MGERLAPMGGSIVAEARTAFIEERTERLREKKPGAVLSRQVGLRPTADAQALVTVFVPRVNGEIVPVVIDANGVTVTRNGTTITTPLPVPR